jgi:two-component system chemotaxis response regulator CheB
MLRSLAACSGPVLAVILTGMGQDGLGGCRAVTAAGGSVLAQDEASSVVWGMPGAVAKAGLARALLPPEELAGALLAPWAGLRGRAA